MDEILHGSPEEQEDLVRCEERIEQMAWSWIDGGQALRQINERRLYRVRGHSTFAEYVEAHLSFKVHHAYHLNDAAWVMDNLRCAPGCTSLLMPSGEKVCRPLANLPGEAQPD